MAIKKKGILFMKNRCPDLYELNRELRSLPDGEYAFYVCDKTMNNVLPRLKYLYGVVLKTISDNHPEHPPVDVLYRKFEKMFAPVRTVRLFKSQFSYQDLKSCKADEFDEVIRKIVSFAIENLGMTVMSRLDLRSNDLTEAYVDAYNDQWKDYDRKL